MTDALTITALLASPPLLAVEVAVWARLLGRPIRLPHRGRAGGRRRDVASEVPR